MSNEYGDLKPGDRLPVWALVKALDMPETKVRVLIDDLGMVTVETPNGAFTSRRQLREILQGYGRSAGVRSETVAG